MSTGTALSLAVYLSDFIFSCRVNRLFSADELSSAPRKMFQSIKDSVEESLIQREGGFVVAAPESTQATSTTSDGSINEVVKSQSKTEESKKASAQPWRKESSSSQVKQAMTMEVDEGEGGEDTLSKREQETLEWVVESGGATGRNGLTTTDRAPPKPGVQLSALEKEVISARIEKLKKSFDMLAIH